MTPTVRQYHLFPTDHIPNSPRPLLHYNNVFDINPGKTHCDAGDVWDIFTQNEWEVAWIFRYGQTQLSHFHSEAHECMAVLSGTAKIRFGVADLSEDLEQNTYGSAWEAGAITLDANAGDVFIIPAGVAHKTYNCRPEAEFKLMSPGKGHGIEADDPKQTLSELSLNGYTMMGAYSGGDWDFVQKGGIFEKSWVVPKPKYDPVFGLSEQGLVKTWSGNGGNVKGLKVTYDENGKAVHDTLAKPKPPKARL